MLDRERFDAARRFVLARARPVDRALYLHLFEGGKAGDVRDALRAFRNGDGGFGRALEPDIRLPDSSATATTVALQSLRDVGATADDDLVAGAIRYLVATFDERLGGWAPVPPAAAHHPHAPWWTPDPDAKSSSLHLDAEVVGYLHEYRELVDPAFLAGRTDAVRAALRAPEVALGSYAALGLLRLAAVAPTPLRDELFAALEDAVPATIDPDPDAWGADFQPFWLVVDGPSPLSARLAAPIATSLDREIARQADDGSWPPRWSWGGDWPEHWEAARREWAGEQTVRTLRALRVAGLLPV